MVDRIVNNKCIIPIAHCFRIIVDKIQTTEIQIEDFKIFLKRFASLIFDSECSFSIIMTIGEFLRPLINDFTSIL